MTNLSTQVVSARIPSQVKLDLISKAVNAKMKINDLLLLIVNYTKDISPEELTKIPQLKGDVLKTRVKILTKMVKQKEQKLETIKECYIKFQTDKIDGDTFLKALDNSFL